MRPNSELANGRSAGTIAVPAMKWLVFFPAWVFLLSYLIFKVKEANRRTADGALPALVGATDADRVAPQVIGADKGGAPRPARVSGEEIRAAGHTFAERVQLLPVDAEAPVVTPLWPAGQAGGLATARRTDFRAWRLHAGSELSFYYPDEPGFVVEERRGGAPPPMVGAIFDNRDREAERWYRVVGPGGETWAALSVDRAGGFDRTERFPAGEAFHKWLLAGGAVARASLAEDGTLRRVQWLGRRHRLSLLGWQHVAAHREAYAAFAASVEVAQPVVDGERKLAELVAGEALSSRLGMLERGMDASGVEAVLGRPAGIADEIWVYHEPRRGGDRYFRVRVAEGRFRGLDRDWLTVRKDPPIRGTLLWMLEKTGIRAGPVGGVGYDLGPLRDEDVALIFGELRRRLPDAAAGEWADLCQVAANLAEMRLEDEGSLAAIRARFAEVGLPMRSAIQVLQGAEPEGARNLFVRRAVLILSELRWNQDPGGGLSAELQMLLAYLGRAHAEAEALVLRAAEHPHDAVRAVAFGFWEWFPDERRAALLAAGLEDRSPLVRRRCAEALAVLGADGAGGAEGGDARRLERLLRIEQDIETREHLASALERAREEVEPQGSVSINLESVRP